MPVATRKTKTKRKTTKRKTTSARSTGKKKTSRSTGRTSAKKTAKKKTSGRKKSTRKKSTAKKSSRKKKTGTAAGKKTTTKKKTTRKKAAAGSSAKSRKKTTKKKTSKKKTTQKSAAKTSKKTSGAKKTGSTASSSRKNSSAGSEARPASESKKKRSAEKTSKITTKPDKAVLAGKKRGRSVAEVASSASVDQDGYVFINGRRVRMISTQGIAPAKKGRSKPVEDAAPEELPKIGKTKLTKKQLNHYREMLLIKRAELVGDLSAIEAEALRSGSGNISHMPIHMADIGTDTYDQDFMLGLAESERRHLREIDDALQRIEDRTYGVCQMTGKPIPKARLEAKPWAKYTIEAARIVESQTG